MTGMCADLIELVVDTAFAPQVSVSHVSSIEAGVDTGTERVKRPNGFERIYATSLDPSVDPGIRTKHTSSGIYATPL